MGKNDKATTRALTAVSLEQFQAGVQAVVNLRDAGKLLVFFPRRNPARLICDPKDFSDALAELAGERGLTEEAVRETLAELRAFVPVADVPNERLAARFLEEMRYADAFESMDEELKESARSLLREKAKIVREQLVTKAAKRRLRRLSMATVACLEDVDVELVQAREDHYASRQHDEPFLRLRLRYSRPNDDSFPFFIRGLPALPEEVVPTSSFELECDESDIDFLMLRLRAAKTRLLKTQDKGGD